MALVANENAAAILERYATLLDVSGESAFRVRAYRRAAETVRNLTESLADVRATRGLETLPGIGPGIATALDEFIHTGRLVPLDDLRRKFPESLLDLLAIEGLGPKTVSRLNRELGVTDLDSLRHALSAGTLRGVGRGVEKTVQAGLESLDRRTGKHLLGDALTVARRAIEETQRLRPAATVSLAGSVRRMTETVGDIDIVVADHDGIASLAAITDTPLFTAVVERSDARLRAEMRGGIIADVHLVPVECFGSELVRLTGNAAHVAALGPLEPAREEVDVYAARGLPWIPPELRAGADEIDRARAGRFTALVEVRDIRGEFHCHTTWSDGTSSIAEMAEEAARRGYAFLGISDHSQSLGIARGLSVERLHQQRREIDQTQQLTPLRLFAASEVEVARDGSLDFDDSVLAELDLVIASLHVGLRRPRSELMSRVRRVLENRHVDIIAHPSGRLIERRDGGDFDWDIVFQLAATSRTALEINADPSRLDLNGELARRAIDAGCLLTINCDAHHPNGFDSLEYGVAMARRAGAVLGNIMNCWSTSDVEAWLRDRRRPSNTGTDA